jgi:hypothetical protein
MKLVKQPKGLFLLPPLFCAIGFGILLLAEHFFSKTYSFVKIAQTTSGTITGIDWSTSRDSKGHSSQFAYPVYEFQLNGQPHKGKSTIGSSSSPYQVGERIEVLYDPKNPDKSRIKSVVELWLTSIALGAMGSVFFFMGAFVGWAMIKGAKKIRHLVSSGLRLQAEIAMRPAKDIVNSLGSNHPLAKKVEPIAAFLPLTDHKVLVSNAPELGRPLIVAIGKHSPLSKAPIGSVVTVYVDRNNPLDYAVDEQSLRPGAPKGNRTSVRA